MLIFKIKTLRFNYLNSIILSCRIKLLQCLMLRRSIRTAYCMAIQDIWETLTNVTICELKLKEKMQKLAKLLGNTV